MGNATPSFVGTWSTEWISNGSANITGVGTLTIDDDNGTYEGNLVKPGVNQSTVGTCSVSNNYSGTPTAIVYTGTWQVDDGSNSGPFVFLLDLSAPDFFGGYYGVKGSSTVYPWCGQRTA